MFRDQLVTDADPVLLEPGHEDQFAGGLIQAAHQLEQANEIIQVREAFDPDIATETAIKELEDEGGEVYDTYQELVNAFGGEDIAKGLVGTVIGADESEISNEEYEAARATRDEAAMSLVAYVCGYQKQMHNNLARAYGEDGTDVERDAWIATWKKIHSILLRTEGTLLAEVAAFFDDLVKDEHGANYQPMERLRGSVIEQDIAAMTFYEVMENHLHRAIVRASEDEWTGYE